MRALILGAGLGTRMAPLCDACAKPSLPVLDRAIVARLVDELARGGVERVVVNTHAWPETMQRALRDAALPVEWSHEPVLRGSAGAIRAARPMIDAGDGEPVLVVNGDMLLDLDLPALRAAHAAYARSGALATLGLRDDPRKADFGSLGFDTDGRVTRITEFAQVSSVGPESGSGLFIGVALLEPAVLDRIPDRETSEAMPDLYVPLLRASERIGIWLQPTDARWWPVGTPRELLEANLGLVRGDGDRVDPGAAVAGRVRRPAWIGAGARVDADAVVGPHAVIGAGARVREGTSLERALVLPGAVTPSGRRLVYGIAYERERWMDG